MDAGAEKTAIIRKWQRQVDAWQGLGKSALRDSVPTVGPFERAFPDQVFPVAALHEFQSFSPSDAASTQGFLSALCGKFLASGGTCLWMGGGGKVFPPALTYFGLDPSRIVFIDAPRTRDVLWAVEEALKCDILTAVIGEVSDVGFTESRRLQLAVEKSGVCCLLHRHRPRTTGNLACTSRWHIRPLPSLSEEGLPGVGLPFWDVQLLKVRNGRPGSWQLGWADGQFTEKERPQEHLVFTQSFTG
ncbi:MULTISPECIES: ImuA family protein [unclassified Flavobacterium]|uniref:ImuA family protein n=1 Tax=unclassified Flavobacterium TaxID=196869 RepID=UPI001F13CA07|nr:MULTISPECIES: hypothetical protein [unclassified Flavobacterium]UMY64957.1 hypothetical protein MKO97_10590 [Flavobacterium sp. HJ-32-4]